MHALALGLCILDITAFIEVDKVRNKRSHNHHEITTNLQARLKITNMENLSKHLCVVRALLPDDRSDSRHGVH